MIRPLFLVATWLVPLFTMQQTRAAGASYYVKKDTWWETMLASRQTLREEDARAGRGLPLPDFATYDLTIIAWVKTTTGGTIVSKAPVAGRWAPQTKSFFVRDGRLHYTLDRGFSTVSGQAEVDDGQWHHVALVSSYKDASAKTHPTVRPFAVVRLYVDGLLDGEKLLFCRGADVPEHVVKIGYTFTNFPRASGSGGVIHIDEVRIYNRALSQREIEHCSRGSLSKREKGLVAFWRFDKDASDVSGNRHHGQISQVVFIKGKMGRALEFSGNAVVTIEPSSEQLRARRELWNLVRRDFKDDQSQREIFHERRDCIWNIEWGSGEAYTELARSYAERCLGTLADDARKLANMVKNKAGLQEVRDMYHRSRCPHRTLAERLDLNRSGLEGAKAAVMKGDYEAATIAFVEYLRSRPAPAHWVKKYYTYYASLEDHPGSVAFDQANNALNNYFQGVDGEFQKVPDDIPWDFKPMQDNEWPVQWNRHIVWIALGKVYQSTKDEKYTHKWLALMRDWIADDEAEPRFPWNTLNIACRVKGSWESAYFAFIDSPSVTAEDHAVFLNSLHDQAELLLPNTLIPGSRGGNIRLSIIDALMRVATDLPEFKRARIWLDTAIRDYESQIFEQVYPDGAQIELTIGYSVRAIATFREAVDKIQAVGEKVSDKYLARLEKMHEYAMCLVKPDGTMPMLGDSNCEPWKAISHGTGKVILTEGARRFFDRPDMLFVGTRGKEGTTPSYLDTQLPDAGYYVLRTDWVDPRSIYLFMDIAHHWGGAHQHYDALAIILYAYGRTLMPDSGKYTYARGDWRRYFRSTSAHSTVSVDDKDQNTSPARTNCFAGADAVGFVDGEHDGYEGLTHRRQLVFARPVDGITPYFIVIDQITGSGSHVVDQYFHFLQGSMDIDSLESRTTNSSTPNVLTCAIRTEGVSLSEADSWVSYEYNVKHRRPAVRYRQSGDLPKTFVTLLLPIDGLSPPPIVAEEVENDSAIVVRVESKGITDYVFVANEPMRTKTPEFDNRTARAALARFNRKGQRTRLELIDEE